MLICFGKKWIQYNYFARFVFEEKTKHGCCKSSSCNSTTYQLFYPADNFACEVFISTCILRSPCAIKKIQLGIFRLFSLLLTLIDRTYSSRSVS